MSSPVLEPDWGRLRSFVDGSQLLSADGRALAAEAIGYIEQVIGEEWMATHWSKGLEIPHELMWPGHSPSGFLGLVRLYAALRTLEPDPELPKVINEVRRNPPTLAHARAQLELAAGLKMSGEMVLLEPPLTNGKQADLAWNSGGTQTVAEIKVLGNSKRWREIMTGWRRLQADLERVSFDTRVALHTDLTALPAAPEAEELVRQIRCSALRVRLTRRPERVAIPGATVIVQPDGPSPVTGSGPPAPIESGRRLTDTLIKAITKQLAAADAAVLVVDVRDGLWQFTEFAAQVLRDKISMLDGLLRPVLQEATHLEAVAVTSGIVSDWDRRPPVRHQDRDGAAVRTRLGCGNVRESIVVPNGSSRRSYSTLVEYFAREDELGHAQLRRLGLPTLGACFLESRNGA